MLTHQLKLDPIKINDFQLSKARRHKYIMGECVRSAGLRAVKQFSSKSWEEAAAYIIENFCKSATSIPSDSELMAEDNMSTNGEQNKSNETMSTLLSEQTFNIVLKPVDSAGADGVFFVKIYVKLKWLLRRSCPLKLFLGQRM
jgi:biotin carboxylase